MHARDIPTTFVYQHPSIIALASFISSLVGGENGSRQVSAASAIALMNHLVEKYSTNLPDHHPSLPAPARDVVLLTGTTGALGAVMLSKLVESSEVAHIYAVNRVVKEEIKSRQRASQLEKELDPAMVESSKIIFVEMDVGEDHLGISPGLLDEVSPPTMTT